MKSYFVFVLVLTVAYLIYYAVIIVQDLYGKRERTERTRRYSASAYRMTSRA